VLVTPNFVVLHIPKTGGLFLRSVCFKHFDVLPETEEEIHLGYRHLPDEARNRPCFTLVRNPWDWYVSWFAYVGRNGDFRSFVKDSFNGPACRKHGLYMAQLLGMVGSFRAPYAELGRRERLAEDFLAFLARHGIDIPPGLSEDLQGPPINTTQRGDYRSYYDAPTRQLVEDACRPLIRRFGYTF
jgi:hypothetical protein